MYVYILKNYFPHKKKDKTFKIWKVGFLKTLIEFRVPGGGIFREVTVFQEYIFI